MTNFYEYLNYDVNKQLKILEKIVFTPMQIEEIKSIKNVSLDVFAEVYCPDCKAIVAILENLAKINNNITIKYISRRDNKELLGSISTEAKIPTVVFKDKVILSEIPNFIKNMINEENKEEIVHSFRTGKFNEKIIDYFISILK